MLPTGWLLLTAAILRRVTTMAVLPPPTFGALLKQLRKRAGMTQRDLAAALGYSDS
ncbi:MAG: helix-turn-helix domain-containing protein, partial [Caldilineaceae bacterium]|nr:helix-turn-helix domain-containing protein [Caldilineaceae bacterium]